MVHRLKFAHVAVASALALSAVLLWICTWGKSLNQRAPIGCRRFLVSLDGAEIALVRLPFGSA